MNSSFPDPLLGIVRGIAVGLARAAAGERDGFERGVIEGLAEFGAVIGRVESEAAPNTRGAIFWRAFVAAAQRSASDLHDPMAASIVRGIARGGAST